MTPGMQLISRIVRTGELSPAIEYGITSEDFPIAIEKSLWDTIVNYYSVVGNAGAVIGPNMLRTRFPQVELCDDFGMTVQALCTEVRKRRITLELKAAGDALLESLDHGQDPMLVMNDVQSRISHLHGLGLSKNTDVTFGAALTRILNRHEALKQGVPLSKLSWPWEIMNEMTGGRQDDDYIIYYGRPKNMKSWVLAADIAHAFNCGAPALLYTKEMVPDNLYMRIAACVLGVPYQDFRMGRLQGLEERELYELRDFVHMMSHGGTEKLVCLSGADVPDGGDTMHWLRAKIDRYKPSVVYIDGVYLMSDGSRKPTADWARVTTISRAARQLQLATKIPFICTVQANRGAAKHTRAELDEIAYADALGQDATVAFRVIAEHHQPTIALITGGSREFKLNGFRIGGIPATDFAYKEILNAEDVNQAKKNDKTEKDKEDPADHSRERRARKPRGLNDGEVEAQVQRAMQEVTGG